MRKSSHCKVVKTDEGVKRIPLPRSAKQREVLDVMMERGLGDPADAVKIAFPEIPNDKAAELAFRMRKNPDVQKAMTKFVSLLDIMGLDDLDVAAKLKELMHAKKKTRIWNKAFKVYDELEEPDYAIQDKAVEKILKLKDKYPNEIIEETLIQKILKTGDVSIDGAEEVAYKKKIIRKGIN